MSADGRTAFSVSDDATVKTWAVPSCSAQDYADRSHLPAMTCDDGPRPPILASCERTLSGHGGPVYAVVVDDAAGVVYTGSADMTIKAWSVADGSCLRTLAGHFADISQLVLDPDGKRLFSASDVSPAWPTTSSQPPPYTTHVSAASGARASSGGGYPCLPFGRSCVTLLGVVSGCCRVI